MLVYRQQRSDDHTFFWSVCARMKQQTRSSTKYRMIITQDRSPLVSTIEFAYLQLDHKSAKIPTLSLHISGRLAPPDLNPGGSEESWG